MPLAVALLAAGALGLVFAGPVAGVITLAALLGIAWSVISDHEQRVSSIWHRLRSRA